MKNVSLYISSAIFMLISIIQFLRYELGVQVTIGNGHHIPLEFSLYSAGSFLVLAIWMLLAGLIGKRHNPAE